MVVFDSWRGYARLDHHCAGDLEHLSQFHQLSGDQAAGLGRVEKLDSTVSGQYVLGLIPKLNLDDRRHGGDPDSVGIDSFLPDL